ncbi:uncharacterized protein LOC123880438 [Maniola jurtina]|uniref:uncharacterized protein LOC123880438 n=1 Tax=Maniola jurtina TaxID=191418 RepID=UPI001E68A9A0|nr:uncharacterized protein LOC123880438 [Maniola jurtina]XP_045784522.1 uncharacterized protein LOC123880438 [Maniola jurtina]
MQVTQEDTNSCKRVGVEEHLIKFKPSPNFKNMKKFIKSRSETTTSGAPVPVALSAPVPPPPPNLSRMDLRPDWQRPEVQPPLPTYPPPQDFIPNLQVKEEVVDTEYETNNVSQAQGGQEETPSDQNSEQSSSEICRDFIRGTCKREGTCKYAHKHDLSQLEGVYTFCRKFQNSVCTFANCKYVHATVFEEQNFYRTGVLPAHALHHKVNNMLQPPPPPPPEEPVAPFNVDFSNPPPILRTETEKPMISCIPESSMASSTASSMEAPCYMGEIHNQMPLPTQTQMSSLKRDWNNMEAYAAPPCDDAYTEPLAKKCKHCYFTEFRLEHNKTKLKKMIQKKEQMSKKMAQLDKQTEKLRSLISELLRPTISSKAQPHNMNGPSVDRDTTIQMMLEQLKNFLGDDK